MNNIPTWNVSEDILAVWGRNWYYVNNIFNFYNVHQLYISLWYLLFL